MIPTKDDLIYEVCAALGRSEDDAVLSLVDKLLLMFERQHLLQQTPCTTQLPSDDELFAIVEKILFEQTSSDPMTECVNKVNLLRQFINDKCLSAIA